MPTDWDFKNSLILEQFKQFFEKVGEATETALIVLAEKMNPSNVSKTGLDRRSAAIAVRQDMESKWRKVCIDFFNAENRQHISGNRTT